MLETDPRLLAGFKDNTSTVYSERLGTNFAVTFYH